MKNPQTQIQPKIEKPHIGKPNKVAMITTLVRELPEDCKLSDHDLVKHLYYKNHYTVDTLLDVLIELCEEKEKDINIPMEACKKYSKVKEEAKAWELDTIFVD